MFFAPNATLRSGNRSNDVARLCPNPADGQRRLIAPLTDALAYRHRPRMVPVSCGPPPEGPNPTRLRKSQQSGSSEFCCEAQMCCAMECARHFKATTEGD